MRLTRIRNTLSADAVRAGTDLECGSEYASLADAVKAGLIDEKEIDISLKRLLTARFELGEMDEQPAWAEIPTSVLNSKEHQALALRMARESLVLLQNKKQHPASEYPSESSRYGT